jgi:hypothetical protein
MHTVFYSLAGFNICVNKLVSPTDFFDSGAGERLVEMRDRYVLIASQHDCWLGFGSLSEVQNRPGDNN